MPRRKGGLFLPLDVSFWDDPKVVRAGEKAAVLYLRMALAAKRWGTDGELDVTQMGLLHTPDWRKRIEPLLRENLVWAVDSDRYWITGWGNHNDPIAVVNARREEDAERKRKGRTSERSPNGHGKASAPSPSVEKREVEKNEVRVPAEDCEHGVDRFASCLQCAKAATA